MEQNVFLRIAIFDSMLEIALDIYSCLIGSNEICEGNLASRRQSPLCSSHHIATNSSSSFQAS